MAGLLESLRNLQAVEHDLAQVRSRLRSRKSAVALQERKINQLTEEYDALHQQSLTKRAEADSQEVDLKARDAQVAKLRGSLNNAKTNKEYAAILTQINTIKADNAKLEEHILRIMQDVDAVNAEAQQIRQSIESEQKRLADIRQTSQQEIDRLNGMMEELTAKRAQAAQDVPREALAAFERIAANYDGEAMAVVEVHGKKPPYTYVCGGCFMGLNPEHANALHVRDEIRTCDNCGRILYIEPAAKGSMTP